MTGASGGPDEGAGPWSPAEGGGGVDGAARQPALMWALSLEASCPQPRPPSPPPPPTPDPPAASRAEPVRDIRCEFCGEFFENRKGLSSHARSHLRQMGVTEWSVNGSPIDTLREILKKKSKPCLIKKEPPAGDLAPTLAEDGPPTAAPGPVQSPLLLSPLAGRPGKPGAGPAQVPRELSLTPITGAKPSATGFLGSVAAKRPLQEDRLLPAEVKAKTYIQTELPFKAKTLHEKTSHSCKQWVAGSWEGICQGL